MIKKILLTGFCLLSLFISPLLNGIVAAQSTATSNQGISLQVSPLPIELTTKAGASISANLRVRNVGAHDEQLQVRLLRVTADDNGGIHLAEPGTLDEWLSWVHFSKAVFDAPPGQWQTIKMTIDVPKTAAFGYYFAVEYLRAVAEAPQSGRAVARGAVATFVLLNADAPGGKRQAQLISFSANKKSYEFLPANFSVKIRSTGNLHVAPHGNIFILKGGKQVDSIQVNSALGNILPNSSRFFQASWSNGFPVYTAKHNGDDSPAVDKHGKPVQSLSWDFSKANHLRFGHYTAHLVMVYDNGQRDVPMDAYVNFWVVPWLLIIYILLIILGPALLVYLFMRWRFKKHLYNINGGGSHGK